MPAPDLAELRRRDAVDPLAPLRAEFVIPAGRIYLDGNSLGLASKATLEAIDRVAREQWARDAIAGWTTHAWIDAPTRVGDKLAPLIGADPGEVVITDSTTMNLFRLLVAALEHAGPTRRVIAIEANNFPADNYIAEGVAAMAAGLGGAPLELRRLTSAQLDAGEGLDERTAVVVLSHVNYLDGSLRDMAKISARARACGALSLWDLAHSAGALPVELGRCGADLAVGCGYKYLNGGPGAPAFLYVRRPLQTELRPPMWGWLGHAQPFAFDSEFTPAPDIRRFVCGTPPILSLAALEAAIDMFAGVDLGAARAKALSLSQTFIERVDARCSGHGLTWACPLEPEARGNQVSLQHPEGYAIVQALIAREVVPDFRAPDRLRFGFAPLYLRHEDVYEAVERLRELLDTRAWDRPEFRARKAVT